MSATSDPASTLLADISRRWQSVDQLLPAPDAPEPGSGCGAVFTVPGAGGRLSAAGWCEHWHCEPESLEQTWGAARRYQLTARVAGPDVAAALDALLEFWRVHLASVPGVDDPDSAAVVMWPSRDVDGIRTLLHRGLAPRSVVAARVAGRARHGSASPAGGSPPVPAPLGCHVRRAGPQDVGTVVRLALEVIRYDAHFGGVIERPSTETALQAEMAALLAEPEPWVWLAERDRYPLGVLIAERPPVQWIAPLVGVGPLAYNMLTWVSPADRGTGAAAALVGLFHAASDAAGVPATLLHFEHANPLSAPFWARHGYRPLWTSWEARPACTMR